MAGMGDSPRPTPAILTPRGAGFERQELGVLTRISRDTGWRWEKDRMGQLDATFFDGDRPVMACEVKSRVQALGRPMTVDSVRKLGGLMISASKISVGAKVVAKGVAFLVLAQLREGLFYWRPFKQGGRPAFFWAAMEVQMPSTCNGGRKTDLVVRFPIQHMRAWRAGCLTRS